MTTLARIGLFEHSRIDGELLLWGAMQTETGQPGGRSQSRYGSWQEADRREVVMYINPKRSG